MYGIPKISEAAAMALHAADLMARTDGAPRPAAGLAQDLGVPYNHMAKVLQRLTRAGLVTPARGPRGGFGLSPSGRKARVRDFIAALDGPPERRGCLMKAKVCRRGECIFGDFLAETNRRFEAALGRRLAEFSVRR